MSLPTTWLRRLSWLEGASFILLLGVGLPLKYVLGKPEAVKVFGPIHGALFILVCGVLLGVMRSRKWSLRRGAFVFMAALVPLGPFIFDGRIARWEAESPTGQ